MAFSFVFVLKTQYYCHRIFDFCTKNIHIPWRIVVEEPFLTSLFDDGGTLRPPLVSDREHLLAAL